MALILDDSQIRRIVGEQAFHRGMAYAEDGSVFQMEWAGSGTQLLGAVRGSRRTPYAVNVTFTVNATGVPRQAAGRCSCPMRSNCKHVAALLLAYRAHFAVKGTERDQIESASRPPSPAASPPAASPPASPPAATPAQTIPAWMTALDPIARTPSTGALTGSPVALQFVIGSPERSFDPRTGLHSSGTTHRLHLRPMVVGKTGRWIRGQVTWSNAGYMVPSIDERRRTTLASIAALVSPSQRYVSQVGLGMRVDGFDRQTLWHVIEQARTAGIPLILDARRQPPVQLPAGQARLAFDLSREAAGLTLSPTLSLGATRLELAMVGFIGSPAHSIFSWNRDGSGLLIAPLSSLLDAPLLSLAAQGEIMIPASDEHRFLTDYYPHLRDQIPVASTDGSVALPERPRPRLALEITHTDAGIDLYWAWHYSAVVAESTGEPDAASAGPDPAPAQAIGSTVVRPLRRATGDQSPRDDAREAEILEQTAGILSHLPLLVPEGEGPPIEEFAALLDDRASLSGAAMIQFLMRAVPEFDASDDLIVTVAGDTPDYREADQPPVITLATGERDGERDWFDLAVTVSVDGEQVPFNQLFMALATGDDVMILSTGVWFSLDRPELHQLRRLIEEARGLQDVQSDELKLSRYQSDLWEELQELGLVSSQAAAWRHAVAGLSDAAQRTDRAIPTAVHAQLRDYQKAGFGWLAFLQENRLGGVLADDMGLGKTLQAIALMANVQQESVERAPFLVVAPTSVVSNWAAECAKFAPGMRAVPITETSAKRGLPLAALAAGADVVITSYALFRLDFEEYQGMEWSGLLLDEAQFVKNHQSRAYQCARRLSVPFKLAITGTPLENNLMELWSLLSVTAPGLFPSPSRFAEFYQKPIEKESNAERLAQLRRRIRPFMLRRTKEEVASDLPAKQEQVLELELNPKHRTVYQRHLQRERQKVLGLIDDMNANRFEIFRSLTMLRQLSLDASLYDEKYANVPSTKLDALMELLDDVVAEGHRTLIFSQFTGYLAKARARLDAAGISYSYLDGRTRKRAQAIDDFKNGSTSVFLISLKAGGFGLNLTEADYCILLDPWWNPATEAQAVDRAHRIGQTKNVMVYRLVAKDTIEEKVMALKATKAKLFDSVMTGSGASGTALSASDIRELLA